MTSPCGENHKEFNKSQATVLLFLIQFNVFLWPVTKYTHGRLESICFKNGNMPRIAGLVEDLFLL